MTSIRPSRPLLVIAFAALLGAAACSGAASASSGGASASPPSVTGAPPAGSGGGGTPGDPGTGVGVLPPDPTAVDPGAQAPTLVMAKPGQLDAHPVGVQRLQTSVDGRHVLVKVTWTSGVEPCNVLDSVRIDRTDHGIALTVIEGSSNRDAMCIEIAMVKATIVDLGDLEPGTWTISSPNGEAPPVEVTIA